LKNFLTFSGRRWNQHGSGKEASGKEASSKEASQEGGSKEEIIFTFYLHLFHRNRSAGEEYFSTCKKYRENPVKNNS
jgi:hypothetical protein